MAVKRPGCLYCTEEKSMTTLESCNLCCEYLTPAMSMSRREAANFQLQSNEINQHG
jgi:hypothetical protein